MRVEQMIAAHPRARGEVNVALARCIEACFDCAQTCGSCADACLGEEQMADLVRSIRLNLDCSDICLATGLVADRRSGGDVSVIQAQLEACRLTCARCADECVRHAEMHEHCRICAEVCRDCEAAGASAMQGLSPTH